MTTTSEYIVAISQLEMSANTFGHFDGNRQAVHIGNVLGALEDKPSKAHDSAYDGIPTMVTPRELRLLQNFFATRAIDGLIMEFGPYLGGSTAAIISGLAASGFSGRYYAFDAFSWDDPAFISILSRDFESLGGAQRFGERISGLVCSGDWLGLFSSLHRSRNYGRIEVRPCRFVLPTSPTDLRRPLVDALEASDASAKLGAVFIDGFKSWHATHVGMTEILPYLKSGTKLIFQDFSWYDCYWLPILIAFCGDRVRLTHKVDNTAIFDVVNPDLGEAIHLFGPTLDPDKKSSYAGILRDWATAQFHSGDEVGFLCHSAQLYVLLLTARDYIAAADQVVFLRSMCERLNVGWLAKDLERSDFSISAA